MSFSTCREAQNTSSGRTFHVVVMVTRGLVGYCTCSVGRDMSSWSFLLLQQTQKDSFEGKTDDYDTSVVPLCNIICQLAGVDRFKHTHTHKGWTRWMPFISCVHHQLSEGCLVSASRMSFGYVFLSCKSLGDDHCHFTQTQLSPSVF